MGVPKIMVYFEVLFFVILATAGDAGVVICMGRGPLNGCSSLAIAGK